MWVAAHTGGNTWSVETWQLILVSVRPWENSLFLLLFNYQFWGRFLACFDQWAFPLLAFRWHSLICHEISSSMSPLLAVAVGRGVLSVTMSWFYALFCCPLEALSKCFVSCFLVSCFSYKYSSGWNASIVYLYYQIYSSYSSNVEASMLLPCIPPLTAFPFTAGHSAQQPPAFCIQLQGN